jgi:protein gp37
MSSRTGIEWTRHTFNPVWGCMKVSPGCANCYAETWAERFGHKVWGPAGTTERRTFGAAHWREPVRWNRQAALEGERRRVFCGSMCDIFEDHPVVDAEREKLWPLIRATPWLDWLLLTKRPERLATCLPADWGHGYDNVWLGTSVENQKAALERIPALLAVDAACHFLSCEPLLGPVELRGAWHDWLAGWTTEPQHSPWCDPHGGCHSTCPEPLQVQTNAVRWVIAGGESGAEARPCDEAWLRTLRDDCFAVGAAFFLKQLGGHPDKRGHEAAVLDGHRFTDVPHVCPGCKACIPDVVDPHHLPEDWDA